MQQEQDQRILSAADDLFNLYGIKSVTMDDISRSLGMSKKTIYQHFEDKNQLVLTLVQRTIEEHQTKYNEATKSARNAVEEIVRMMQFTSDTFSRANPNKFYDLQKYHPAGWQLFRQYKEEIVMNQVIANLEKGRKQGLYRTDFSIKILARLRLEEIEMAMHPQYYTDDRLSMHEVQVQLLDHYLHGICTLKGHKLLNKYKQLTEEE
jgi:AcrR family transcriptional regulator